MAANSSRGASLYGGAAPYRSREGLSTRPVAGSDEIQLRIDPMQADFDDEISGLRSQVRQLRNVAQEIGMEAKFHKDFLDKLFCDLTANDRDKSSSRCEEQHKEIEQEHH
ncbi:bet1-like protein At4g14600 isoform X2 [Hevea brasiliensis]|uniref:bet1-like protein At4g14600 isoform X2 n=1 Tax=Hevea brasiliensis TaxID=3981 RepID=UPI0025E8F175|nr:bet1-like protein At4g14600 isoform X2 [Hevea brasiliensis]